MKKSKQMIAEDSIKSRRNKEIVLMKKRPVIETEDNQVNIRQIRNREQKKTQGKLIEKQKEMEKKYKNAHSEVYGESEDSDDERILSKIGRLQQHKYKDKDFIGYDENLNKIHRKEAFDDKISEFLAKSENKDWWRVVRDELNNQDVVLSDKQLDLLDRIRKGKAAKQLPSEYFEYDDYDLNDMLQTQKPKRRFTPSKWERIKINKLVQGIKLGRIKLEDKFNNQVEQQYDVWGDEKPEEDISKYLPQRIPAPKSALPTNVYSYNPPQEYLFTPEEKQLWLQTDPEDRELPFIPQAFRYLRQVPSEALLTRDLFNRCLDLYLCPRVRRQKLTMKSQDFLVNLPDPQELKPFPTHINQIYTPDQIDQCGAPINLSISPDGDIIAACFTKSLVLFDARTTRCIKTLKAEKKQQFYGVQFNSTGQFALLKQNSIEIIIINSHPLWTEAIEKGRISVQRNNPSEEYQWEFSQNGENEQFSTQVKIELKAQPKFINFHIKSDYLVSTQPDSTKKSECILVHCFSKAQTQVAFHKLKSTTEVQQTYFHPTQPHLIIMTKKHVFIYSLSRQSLIKKLLTGNQWNSSLEIHPSGDHILLGSQDKKVCWFDLDMGVTPYKKMQYHERGVSKVTFHHHFPLFASSSDDGTINIFHGKVSNDLAQQALIVPLKVLKQESKTQQLPVKDIVFHPVQPWLFSLYSNGIIHSWS